MRSALERDAVVDRRGVCRIAQREIVTLDTASSRDATLLTSTAHTASLSHVPRLDPSGSLRHAVGVVGEFLVLIVLVCCIPFVILAIGSPIALAVRLLLWIGELL